MNKVSKLGKGRHLSGRVAASALTTSRDKQSPGTVAYVLLTALTVYGTAVSAHQPRSSNDIARATSDSASHQPPSSRTVNFSDLGSEGKAWFSPAEVSFDNQAVVVRDGMQTRDGIDFSKAKLKGGDEAKLIKKGHEIVTMRAKSRDFRGDVIVEEGTLQITEYPRTNWLTAKQITVKSGARLAGVEDNHAVAGWAYDERAPVQHIVIEDGGSLQVGPVDRVSTYTSRDFTVRGNLINHGSVFISNAGSKIGNTLYVRGDYHGGPGSIIHMRMSVDDGESESLLLGLIRLGYNIVHDKLVITGNSSGHSRVTVTNLGGNGAFIGYGSGLIKLITVAGNSNAHFTLSGRAVAGAYDYRLVRGDASFSDADASKNWYLVSDISLPKAREDANTVPASAPAEQIGELPSGQMPEGDVIKERPTLLTANASAALPDGLSTSEASSDETSTADPEVSSDETSTADSEASSSEPSDQRSDTTIGQSLETPADGLTEIVPVTESSKNAGISVPRQKVIRPEAGSYNSNAQAANTMFQMTLNDRLGSYYQGEDHARQGSAWLRYSGSHQHLNDTSGQLRTKGDKNTVMMGVDMLVHSIDLRDQVTLGIMGGYGHYHGRTRSNVSGYSSSGKVDGYSVGLYGTYQQNADTQMGLYVDSWLLWNRFDNTVKGDELPTEKYASNGITASAELGYNLKLAERNNVRYVLQPHAQVMLQNVRSDNFQEGNGTHVEFLNRARTQTVLGVRAAAHIQTGLTATITPHIEANWLHSSNGYGVAMNNVTADTDSGRNIAQLKLGVEGELNKRLSLDVALFRNQGNAGYQETGGNVALKYRY